MQLSRLRSIAVASIFVAATAAGCTSANSSAKAPVTSSSASPASASPSSAGPPTVSVAPASALQVAGQSSTIYTYTLSNLSSCTVTDALTVIENRLSVPVRLSSVRVSIVDDSSGRVRTTATVAPYKANTTAGALGATSTLSPLRNQRLLPASCATLSPFAASSLWYELVIHIDVLGSHPRPWSINGISVAYTVGSQKFTVTFPQSVKLAAVHTCPS